ncbi:hypothetical protein HK405_003788 [Cladochytrium tenue]|nr:hypothetical protein HK405_003788 [Cladochytrium tenue]
MKLLSLHAVVFLFALLALIAPAVQAAPIPLPGHEHDGEGKEKKHGVIGAALGALAGYTAYRKSTNKEDRSFMKAAGAVVAGGAAGKAIGDHWTGIKNFVTGKKENKHDEAHQVTQGEGAGEKKKEKKHGVIGAALGAMAGYTAYRKSTNKEDRSFLKATGAVVAGGVAGKVAGDHWSGIKNFFTGKKGSQGGEGEKKHGALGAALGAAAGLGAYEKLVPKENHSFLKAAGAVVGGGIAGKSIGDHWSSIKGFFGGGKKNSGNQDGGYQRDQYQQGEYKRGGGGYENNNYGDYKQKNYDSEDEW